MKRILSLVVVAVFFAILVASCASAHGACDAYSSNYNGTSSHNDIAMVNPNVQK